MYIRSKKLILTKVPWSSGQILEVAASDISCDDPNNKIIMVDGTEQSVVVTYSIVESFCTCERWITCIHIKNLNIHITHKVFTVRYGYLSRPPLGIYIW